MLDAAENDLPDHFGRDVGPDHTVAHAFLDDAQNRVAVNLYQLVGVAAVIVGVVAHLDQQHLGKNAVVGVHVEVGEDQFAKFLQGAPDAAQVPLQEDPVGFEVIGEDLVQQIALVAEVLVDQRFGDAGLSGDLGGGDGPELFPGEQVLERADDLDFARRLVPVRGAVDDVGHGQCHGLISLQLADDLAHDFVGAAADGKAAGIPEIARDRHLGHKAESAVHL